MLNGIELSSGSIRITDPELQSHIFRALHLTEEEAKRKFGHLLEPSATGPASRRPWASAWTGWPCNSSARPALRDVLAFPKVQNMTELMTSCPSPADPAQLEELGLRLVSEENKT